MRPFEEVLEQYQAEPGWIRAEVEPHGKVELLLELETLFETQPDPRIITFLLEVVRDQAEFDLARVEAMKILGTLKIDGEPDQIRIGQAIRDVFVQEQENDPNDLVRIWAGMKLQRFIALEGIFTDAVTEAILDSETPMPARYNALHAIYQGNLVAQYQKTIQIIAQLRNLPNADPADLEIADLASLILDGTIDRIYNHTEQQTFK